MSPTVNTRALDNALQKHGLPCTVKNTLKHHSGIPRTQFHGIHSPCIALRKCEYAGADIINVGVPCLGLRCQQMRSC